MKRILVFILVSFSVYSCKEPVKSEPAQKISDAKSMYEKNLASLKKGIAAFENKNIDERSGILQHMDLHQERKQIGEKC
jgi:hypothetical protein